MNLEKENMKEIKEKIKGRDMKKLYDYRMSLFEKPQLRWLFFELTDQCNLNCRHCGSNCDPARSHYIDTDLVLKTIKEAAEDFSDSYFIICLTGGEPLLHPDFEKIVETINAYDIPWGMTTNATLIDQKMAEKLSDLKMGSISVSLDGLEEQHEWLRRIPGCFDRAVAGIRNLQTAGHSVQVTTVIHRRNYPYLEDIYQFMRQLEVDSWRVVNVDPIGRAVEDDELNLSRQQIIELLQFIREKRFQNGNPMDVCYGCSHYLSYVYEREVRDFYFQCGAGTSIASILCNGDIYGCLDIERRPELVQGNIAKDRFSDVWKNRFEIYRKDRSLMCGECRDCKEREFCGGDSMHTWDFDHNRPMLCLWNDMQKIG